MVELLGQVCAISKMCVLAFVHVNLECCTIKLCSLSHSGTVCSVHFTPVCLQQHMDAADCYVLTVGVLKPFDKVGFFYVCVCVCGFSHSCVHSGEEEEVQIFLSAVALSVFFPSVLNQTYSLFSCLNNSSLFHTTFFIPVLHVFPLSISQTPHL